MAIGTIKRLASDLLHAGVNRVHIRPDSVARAEEALTRSDVRGLIKEGIVYLTPVKGRRKVVRGRRRREGSIRGVFSRADRKKAWMAKVRSQRKLLRTLLEEKKLDRAFRRAVYHKIKSGTFRNKAAMQAYLQDNHMLISGEKQK